MPRGGHIRFSTYPRTEVPPTFVKDLVGVFRSHESRISTVALAKGLTSDQVLAVVAGDLAGLGFAVETGKAASQRIERPVFFGEDGEAELNFQIDGFHSDWRCGIEIEAGRAFTSNAIYRDLIQASLMVDLEHLCLAVPMAYKFQSGGKTSISRDYENAKAVAGAVYSHSRIKMPYRLLVIGY